jgi:transcriptional regulator with PAS, ATPase and Fis domain
VMLSRYIESLRCCNWREIMRWDGAYPVKPMLILRLLLLLATLISMAFHGLADTSDHSAPLLAESIAVVLLFALCGLSAGWVQVFGTSRQLELSQLGLDSFLITGVIYLTGGPFSPFLFLYIPLVMAAVAMFTRDVGWYVTATNTALYFVLCVLCKTGVTPIIAGFPDTKLSIITIVQQLLGLTGAMIVVGNATDYLKKTIQARDTQVHQSTRDLAVLGVQQKTLIDQMSEGVIMTDLSGLIVCVNRAACHLVPNLAVSTRGKSIATILAVALPDFRFRTVGDPLFGAFRSTYPLMGDSHGRTVEVTEQALHDENDKPHGLLFLLRDITAQQHLLRQRIAEAEFNRAFDENRPVAISVSDVGYGLVGESTMFRKVIDLVDRVAKTDATVLLFGESGTGKELIARAIHKKSVVAQGPFIAVNCGAIPESLLESELFGHKRGSFTGATSDHPGVFRSASNGTLFLDEIGELPLTMQAKILRAIQERCVRPVGGVAEVPVSVRIIAATNRNLKREVEARRFREDLFYRLNVVNITIPPLRERKEDIPLLIRHFLECGRGSAGGPKPEISREAQVMLLEYEYPGNIRELENIMERSKVLGGSTILPEHLPDHIRHGIRGETAHGHNENTNIVELPCDLECILEAIERRYLTEALQRSQGIRKEAGALLGLNTRSLRYRIQKHGLDKNFED